MIGTKGIETADRTRSNDRARHPYQRPQTRDQRIRPEHERILESWRRESSERRTFDRFIGILRETRVLPEELIVRIEMNARKLERLKLEDIRLNEADLILFFGRVLETESSLDPIDLVRALIPLRPTEYVQNTIDSMRDDDSRLAEHSPSEVRSILDLVHRHPELKELLIRGLGLDELKNYHEWNVLRLIIHGLLEYHTELGRPEFERRFGRGLTTEALIDAANLSLLHRRLAVTPHWAPEWRMISAAYVRGESLPPGSIKWNALSPEIGTRFLAGLRSTRTSEFRTDRLTFKNQIEALVAYGTTYLEIFEGLTRQEAPLSVEQLLINNGRKTVFLQPAAAAIIDAQDKVEVFGPIFELLVSKPEGLREEEARTILVGILSKETPDSTMDRGALNEPRRTAHEQLLAVVESESPLQAADAKAEARKLIRRSPQALYHTQRYIGSRYSHGIVSSFPQSEAGRFLLDLIDKTIGRPVALRQGFLGSIFALASQQIEHDNLDMHGSVREKLGQLAAAAAELPEAKQIARDAEILSINGKRYKASSSEQIMWEARGRAALLLLVRIFLSPDQTGQLPYEMSAQTALRAAKQLAGVIDYEQHPELAFISYLPSFVLARMGSEFRDRALDELKTALIDGGTRGLLAATSIVQGVARGEIYTDLANILREIDLVELEPEVRLLGHILRSERLQRQYQENLFDMARLLLSEMPSKLLKDLIDLVDIHQYEEVSSRVENWIRDRLEAFRNLGASVQ